MLGLHRLGLLQLLQKLGPAVLLLLGGIDPVPLEIVQGALNVHNPVGAVLAQGVDFFLNAADVLVDGAAKLALLLCREYVSMFRCHIRVPPL